MYVDMCIHVHIFVSVMEKISSGRMSPVRGRTMKEYDTVSTVGKKYLLTIAIKEKKDVLYEFRYTRTK